MIARALERATRAGLQFWRTLSIDARVIASVGVANWLLLFANHTTVADTTDRPLWRLFPAGWDAVFLIACGSLAVLYAVRHHPSGPAFPVRQPPVHLGAPPPSFLLPPP